jgi:hypothetical protein
LLVVAGGKGVVSLAAQGFTQSFVGGLHGLKLGSRLRAVVDIWVIGARQPPVCLADSRVIGLAVNA